jgi:hypothetical protein
MNGCSGTSRGRLWFTIMEASIAAVFLYALSLLVFYWV